MSLGTLGLAFLAGVLTLLSPCVLPLLPIVVGTAQSEHRLGPIALAAGLALSFVAIGLFVATIGFGLDTGFFRLVSAMLLMAGGVLLLVPKLQAQFALAAGPVSNLVDEHFGGFIATSLAGQFGLGLLLGAVWSPCVGPTLGAASILAAKAENLGQVALTMLVFGIGTALPLMLLGLLARSNVTLAQPYDGGGQRRQGVARRAPGGDWTDGRDRFRQAARNNACRCLA
jgi:cytochrome c-type biogenesis protein